MKENTDELSEVLPLQMLNYTDIDYRANLNNNYLTLEAIVEMYSNTSHPNYSLLRSKRRQNIQLFTERKMLEKYITINGNIRHRGYISFLFIYFIGFSLICIVVFVSIRSTESFM